MPLSSPPALLELDLQSGKPPILYVQPGEDALDWIGEHGDALRAIIAQRGSVLVRGLGLRNVPEVSAVFQSLGPNLMIEKEAFASRKMHSPGIYSSSAWPQNLQMCMHHELSYALEFPGLMLFACLTPSSAGGATAVADAEAILDALPKDLVRQFEEHGWMLTRSIMMRSAFPSPRHSARRIEAVSRLTAAPTGLISNGGKMAYSEPGSAAGRWCAIHKRGAAAGSIKSHFSTSGHSNPR